jgi:hypothetical protein
MQDINYLKTAFPTAFLGLSTTLFTTLLITLFVVFLIFSFNTEAQESRKSAWLNAAQGSKDDLLGAQVLKVFHRHKTTIIEVGFSDDALKHFHSAFMENRSSKKIIAYTTMQDLLKDEQNKPYGIRFHFKKLPEFEFRVILYEKVVTPSAVVQLAATVS